MNRALLNEGAESRIYAAKIFGYAVVVKERQAKAYRIPALDQEIRRARTKCEARILARLGKAGVPVPALIAVGTFDIYMERINGTLLKDVKNPDAKTFTQAGRVLAAMHRADVAHGDFTPANLMVTEGRVVVIDFGLSEVTNSMEEKALDLLLMKRSITKTQYATFISYYSKAYVDSAKALKRLESIERRGRYQTRTLA